ncbi:hypothetical protein OAU73_02400 [Candidatus Pelagibacter sp.]|nr:hypothetical protein [Candidatus Pelagibacter sp.]
MRTLYFYESIREALEQSISKDKSVIVMGLGVDDPKGVFGTTLNLHKKFESNVYDLPTAENTFTGIGLGLAISGYKPVIVHQRVEFSLLSIEQIFNQISKWFFMSGGKVNVPIVIRLIIGKGWGQGPQHSQSLEAIFSHIPGLKVVCPSNSYDAKGMLISSIEDPDPVIFFEHRWLHSTKDFVPKKNYRVPLKKCSLISKGKDLTIVSFSYPVLECIKAVQFLKKYNINCELIDLRCLRPIDYTSILNSVRKTKKILVVDNGWIKNGISAEILAYLSENLSTLKNKYLFKRIGLEDTPIPSSVSLAKHIYPEETKIIKKILGMLNKKINKNLIPPLRKNPDQPDKNFQGPF